MVLHAQADYVAAVNVRKLLHELMKEGNDVKVFEGPSALCLLKHEDNPLAQSSHIQPAAFIGLSHELSI
ncbi:hypothetical protein [Bradyrhizobium icense]|uniref:Uncharacterized protein n=1 Tax=Bradyrhizobium icense TaxID=1274631 RepID=A0A1B1UBM1_9BRAD|nr:hypothetical protein [Bradyrhizobium icense]ANW00165.1 hypothetical protein LMTR13_08215 [Bradyrhizobium icense]